MSLGTLASAPSVHGFAVQVADKSGRRGQYRAGPARPPRAHGMPGNLLDGKTLELKIRG